MKPISFVVTIVPFCVHLQLDLKSLAGTADLNLDSGGTLLAIPTWTNSANQNVTTLTFIFSGIAGNIANTAVDSNILSFKLLNAPSYPSTVSVTVPTQCNIGATSVQNANVVLIRNTLQLANSFSIPDNSINNYALRFLPIGNYGNKSGAINCLGSGHLIYSY